MIRVRLVVMALTVTDHDAAVLAATGRRVLRNVNPDARLWGSAAVTQLAQRYLEQVARRHAAYVALVYGHGQVRGDQARGVEDLATSLRAALAQRVIELLDADPALLPGP